MPQLTLTALKKLKNIEVFVKLFNEWLKESTLRTVNGNVFIIRSICTSLIPYCVSLALKVMEIAKKLI